MKPFIPLIAFLGFIILASPNPDTTPMIHFVSGRDTLPGWIHIDTVKRPHVEMNWRMDNYFDFVFVDSAGTVLSYGGKVSEPKKLFVRDSLAAIKCMIKNYFLMMKNYESVDSAKQVIINNLLDGYQTSYKSPL